MTYMTHTNNPHALQTNKVNKMMEILLW